MSGRGPNPSPHIFGLSLLASLGFSLVFIGLTWSASQPSGTPGASAGDVTRQLTQLFPSPQWQPPATSPGGRPPQGPPSTLSPLGTGFAGGMVPVRLLINQPRNCYAIAPGNWVIYGATERGNALDMATTDGSMAASFGIGGVSGQMKRLYPHLYGTPEIGIHNSLSVGGKAQVAYGQPMRDVAIGYTWQPFEIADPNVPAEPARGVLLYRIWSPLPGDPDGYIVLGRRGQTARSLWQSQGALAIAVALSIRCTVQLQPTGGRDDDRAESTYNQQLGMEYAHDPVTGENYWVSPGADWQDSGPQGPGYYKRSGNDLRKLAPGRSAN
jgi:hypothetical protein